jgi:uncharacterized OsmC-like protein
MSSAGVEGKPKVQAELMDGYRFKISFPGTSVQDTIIMDEPPPLGNLYGPNASRVLVAAVVNCLSASLLFCLRKSKIEVKGLKAEAEPTVERNKDGYWRVKSVDVRIKPEFDVSTDETRTKRCLDIFENYCVVTGAIREGITVNVTVDTDDK